MAQKYMRRFACILHKKEILLQIAAKIISPYYWGAPVPAARSAFARIAACNRM